MKKIVAFCIIVVLSSAANIQVFSQKTRTKTFNKIPFEKNEKPVRNNDVPADVKLQSAAAYSDGNGVYLRWQSEYENRNLGFYIYRDGKTGRALVGEGFVPGGRATSSEDVVYGGIYEFFDAAGDLSNTYYIESFQLNGDRRIIGKIAPQYTDNLKPVAGSSSSELAARTAKLEEGSDANAVELPGVLRKEFEGNQLLPDMETQRWVAAQPGAKISIKQDGLYRVSRTELQNAGFDVNAPSSQWQLYVDGVQQSIIIGANDSYIEFYGKGIDTPESDTKVYYLVVGTQNGLRMGSTTVRPLSGNIVGQSYYQSFVRKDRKIYLSPDILNGDMENFFSLTVISGSSSPTPPTATVNFNLSGVDFNALSATFELAVQGISGTPHQVVPRLNGEQLAPISGNGFVLSSGSYQIPTTFLREGANTLQLQSFGGAGDTSLVESFKVTYARKFEAMQNRLSFYTNNYRQTTISGFTSPNIRIFDLTFPDTPSVLTNLNVQNNSGNYSITIPSNRGRVAYAVEDSAILAASSVVANIPSTLSTTAHNGELIIVAYKDWMNEANNWANYRRGQGMTVEVVNIEDIYDEFSYGTLSTDGMKQFFQYAKNNWQTAPNYVLLIGDFSYDFRNYENRAFQNFVPTKRVDTIYEETGSDEALCDFNNDGLAELAVGRIPARNAGHVTQMLNKTMAFESGIATLYNRGALCASDLPRGYDFEGLCQRVFDQLPTGISKTYINRGQADSKTLLLNRLNQGPYILNYSGHGSAGIWEGNWLTVDDSTGLNNAPNYTLYMMLTCLNGYFLRTDFDSLGEALLKAPNGGGVAVWASTGKTTPDVQELLATRFYNQLNVGTMTRFGDLIKDAKQNLNGGRDVRLSWALLGDPTMKIKP